MPAGAPCRRDEERTYHVLPKGWYGRRRLARMGSLPARQGRPAGKRAGAGTRRPVSSAGDFSTSLEMTSMDALSHNVISTGLRGFYPNAAEKSPTGKLFFPYTQRPSSLPGDCTVASRHGQTGWRGCVGGVSTRLPRRYAPRNDKAGECTMFVTLFSINVVITKKRRIINPTFVVPLRGIEPLFSA